MTKEIPIVLIGHKDHGKSTLIGRLLLDSKSVKESRLKEIQEVDKISGIKFELAHLVDSFKEERTQEMTIDTTRAILKGKGKSYQLIDVPGHAELISNMLTGASNAEAALLLVSMEEGIKEQTRQHLEIIRLLGIEQLGVVLNKIDKVNYQKEAFEKTVEDLKKILIQIGYPPENIKFFPVSAWNGDNVIKKSEKTSWYQGPTVMEYIEQEIKALESFEKLPLIFLVQNKFPGGEKDILVGRVETGKLKVGQEILFLPSRQKTRVKEIKDSERVFKEAVAGQNIGLVLEDNLDISRGEVGTVPSSNLRVSDKLSGEVFWMEKPSQNNLVLECGTAKIEGELQEPKLINQGEKTFYQINLIKPIVFEPDGRSILGEMVLKDKGKIIGVGCIK